MSHLDSQSEEFFFTRQKEILRRLGPPESPLIIDVGGNVGQSVDAYRNLFPQAQITSFEPHPNCFTELSGRFGSVPGITVENLALADTAGTRPFYVTQCPTASSLLIPDEVVRKKSAKKNYDYESITVSVDTLDHYCVKKNINAIDILKIDVQGAELPVLKGAKDLLKENRIRLIYLEVILAENYQGQSEFSALLSYLAAFHFSLWDINPFLFTRSGRLWTANALFTSSLSCNELEKFNEEFPFSHYHFTAHAGYT